MWSVIEGCGLLPRGVACYRGVWPVTEGVWLGCSFFASNLAKTTFIVHVNNIIIIHV